MLLIALLLIIILINFILGSTPSHALISKEQLDFFNENGYLVIDKFLTLEECSDMRNRMDEILTEKIKQWNSSEKKDTSVFTTYEQERKSDRTFLSSGDKIEIFFEKGALNGSEMTVNDPKLSINKCGHALHDLDPVFERISYSQKILTTLDELGMSDPVIAQSMFIFKQPRIGDAVLPHQDSVFVISEPDTCIGLWFSLENCDKSNGCLFAVPGSHKDFPINRRFVRKDLQDDDKGTTFEPKEAEDLMKKVDRSKGVLIEVGAGAMVVLHGSLVHWSEPNYSDKSRHAYSLHVVNGKAKWSEKNWLQRRSIPFYNAKEKSLKITAGSCTKQQ